MRVFRCVLVFLLLAARAMAAPEPPPPAGFQDAQYIDGAGCVFQRQGAVWQQRLDGRGQKICGFPPTMSYRSEVGSDAPVQSVEEQIFERFSAELRDGEFVADRHPVEPRKPLPTSGPSTIQRDIQTRLRNSAALKVQIWGGADSRLCALLGYSPDPPSGLRYDRDVTQGLCPGMSVAIPSPRYVSLAADTPKHVRVVAPAPAAVPRARPEKASVISATERKQSPTLGPEMIPAHAKYIQVGAFRDSESAMAVARRLLAAGHKVGRIYRWQNGEELQLITVGPFADRQTLVRALAQLRVEGYARAQPR